MSVFFRSIEENTKILPDNIMIYLKTTETCQLDCSHCFTSGRSGKKIFFDVEKVKLFFDQLHFHNKNQGGNIAFHGGEPMLAGLDDMYEIYYYVKNLLPNMWWSITTNLTYKLTDDIKEFFKQVFFTTGIGVSWDLDIRFDNKVQEQLWKKNLEWLVEQGFNVTLMISISKKLTEYPVDDFLNFISSLGIQHVHLERITPNGNAIKNPNIFPSNTQLDEWFLKLWQRSLEIDWFSHKINNLFFHSLLTSLVQSQHSGCRCRECEQKIFTLNADGTVGGCPNSAPELHYGMVTDTLLSLYSATNRTCNINAELNRELPCWSCEVYDVCNGDCHQLMWNDKDGNIITDPTENDVCPAPKSLMKHLKQNYNYTLYQNILGEYLGNE